MTATPQALNLRVQSITELVTRAARNTPAAPYHPAEIAEIAGAKELAKLVLHALSINPEKPREGIKNVNRVLARIPSDFIPEQYVRADTWEQDMAANYFNESKAKLAKEIRRILNSPVNA